MIESTSQLSERILSFLQGLLWLLLLLPINLYYKDILSDHILIAGSTLISVCLAIVSIILARVNRKSFNIFITDVLIVVYIGYILINAFFIRPHPIPDIFLLKLLSAILIYFSVRLMTNKQQNRGLVLIAGAGLLEAFFILLQQSGLLESQHQIFNFTGSFFNPGLTGGFIACSLCILIYFFTETHKFSKRMILLASIALLVYTLILTDSRAGWLAAIVGVCYLLWNCENIAISQIILTVKKNIVFKVILVVAIFGLFLFTYQYKKASADGRLFIWHISLEMFKDKPLSGHGIEMFREKYPHYQASFFMKNPESDNAMIAGEPSVPFNEFLAILTTQGLLGLVLLTAIGMSLLLYRPSFVTQQKRKAFLLTLCIFAFFSYPTGHFRLLILLPFFAAILSNKDIVSVTSSKLNNYGLKIHRLLYDYKSCECRL